MKRSPLRRKTPLKRTGFIRSRSKTNSYRRRERDIDYMLDVKRLPCAVRVFLFPHVTTCEGEVQADHAGVHGLGQKADDSTCIPLCRKHHDEKGNLHGTFRGWTGAGIRQWLTTIIEITQRDVAKMREDRERFA